MLVFGYQKGGEACLFDLEEGEILPPSWSSDISVIEDEAKRSGEAISHAARVSIAKPVKLHAKPPEATRPGPPPKILPGSKSVAPPPLRSK